MRLSPALYFAEKSITAFRFSTLRTYIIVMDFKNRKFMIYNGCDRGLCIRGCGRQDRQLNTYDWLADVPGNTGSTNLVEVQFKNTRKGYYHNVNNLDLKKATLWPLRPIRATT